ncbi:MAG TPA: hypothetical protein VKX17_05020 [Planctomycetota bacterium]|nr:hypothetical protein [Planctomycetota bacterium]
MTESPSLTPPRRRWLRFSLRTLLLCVLLIGSSATLWWNWGPWLPEFVLRSPPDLVQADLLRHGRGLILLFDHPVDKDRRINEIQYIELPSGRIRYSVRSGIGGGYVRISTGESTIQLFNHAPSAQNIPLMDSWNIETGERLDSDRIFHGSRNISVQFSHEDRFVYVCSDFTGERTLLKFPELTPAGNLDELFKNDFDSNDHPIARSGTFSPLGSWFVNFVTAEKVQFIDLKSNFEMRELVLPYGEDTRWRRLVFSPNERVLALEYLPSHAGATNKVMLVGAISFASGDLDPRHRFNSLPYFSKSGEYFVVRNSDDATKEIRRTSDPQTPLWKSQPGPLDWIGDNVLRCDSQVTLLDGATGVTLWQQPFNTQVRTGSITSTEYIALHDAPGSLLLCILNAHTGRTELNTHDWRWSAQCGELHSTEFCGDSSCFLAYSRTDTRIRNLAVARRHSYRWGLASVPEFWLTLVLGAGFLWSVWRDRRLGMRA